MSRLWSRLGVRSAAIALLIAGGGGGYYLNNSQETQQNAINTQLTADAQRAEGQPGGQRNAALLLDTVKKRSAEQEAATKAAEVARKAAERARKAEAEASRKKREEEAASKPYDGPIPASCNEYSGNRKIGCAIMIDAGFKIDQMPCLDKLWNKESGWNEKARNPSSGAYGIPQAYPGSKMGSVADDWETNPATQIKWGLGYIEDRYDTPCGAWQHSQDKGWY